MNVVRNKVNRGVARLFVFSLTKGFSVWARVQYPRRKVASVSLPNSQPSL